MCLHALDRSAVSATRSRNANKEILHQVFTEGPAYTQSIHRFLNNVTGKGQNKVLIYFFTRTSPPALSHLLAVSHNGSHDN